MLLDSSSAILLFKADLFDALVSVYHVSMSQSVLHELTLEDQPGADVFLRYAALKKVKIISTRSIPTKAAKYLSLPASLHRGELDTIKCFQAGGYAFIITDDGRAARYCRQNKIPFINALLFPRVLNFFNNTPVHDRNIKTAKLVSLGRYSAEVVRWAENCKKEALHFAIPGSIE